jgi:carboxylesterase type B
MGITTHELSFGGDGMERSVFEDSIKERIAKGFSSSNVLAELIIQQYTTWDKKDDPIENGKQGDHLYTDFLFWAPTIHMATIVSQQGIPVYVYVFNHYSPNATDLAKTLKSHHSIELNYLFGSPFTGLNVDTYKVANASYSDTDREMSRTMMKLWTNFAKYGNPTPNVTTSLEQWREFHPTTADYFSIDTNSISTKTQYRYDKVQLWNHVMPLLVAEQGNYSYSGGDLEGKAGSYSVC